MPLLEKTPTYADEMRLRVDRLRALWSRVQPVPAEWLEVAKKRDRVEPAPCDRWDKVEAAWRAWGRWRQSLSDALSTCLAVAASTSQTGNQLCLLLVADAGSGKSTLLDGLLVSDKCTSVEGVTGLVSGSQSDDGRDLSFIGRKNHLTWITSEGDVMAKSPNFPTIMSQLRRAYDGRLDWVFKTTDDDRKYVGLRTPWIVAGPPRMLDYWEQSELGDRFLRLWIDQPDRDECRQIVLSAVDNEWGAVAEHSNGSSGGVESRLRRAYALTGGYVNWLRDNASRIESVTAADDVRHRVTDLAEFVADMRARPNPDPRKVDNHDSKELHTRIGRQLVRLARCLAFATNRPTVDGEVMRRVTKVALDSARGRTMDVLRWFRAIDSRTGRAYQEGSGVMAANLTKWAAFESEPKCLAYLNFLLKIGVAEHVESPHSHGYWRMTRRVADLYANMG